MIAATLRTTLSKALIMGVAKILNGQVVRPPADSGSGQRLYLILDFATSLDNGLSRRPTTATDPTRSSPTWD
jgi:hypothetical protein